MMREREEASISERRCFSAALGEGGEENSSFMSIWLNDMGNSESSCDMLLFVSVCLDGMELMIRWSEG